MSGNSTAALHIAQQGSDAIAYHPPFEQTDATAKKLFQGYRDFVEALKEQQAIADIIKKFDSYRVLCTGTRRCLWR